MRELNETEIDTIVGAGWFDDWTGPTECPVPEIPRQFFASLPEPQGEYVPALRSVLRAGATPYAGSAGGTPSIIFRPWKGGPSYSLTVRNGLAVVGQLP